MPSTRENIAKQVNEARKRRGITQAQVSQGAKISVTYYAMIERGEVNATSDILARIGKILGITIKI